jgi:glycine cleavage system H lipoate-binding protein/ABC-type phosphate transport system substrate-binding protein
MNSNFKAMKKIVLVLIGAALLLQGQAVNIPGGIVGKRDKTEKKGLLTISSTPDLFNLVSRWASDYTATHPEMKVQVTRSAVPDAGLVISFDDTGKESMANQWKMVIGRDAVVPVINSQNPLKDAINTQGISAAEFSRLLAGGGSVSWSSLLDGVQDMPVHVYLPDNEPVKSTVADYVHASPTALAGTTLAGGPELVAAMLKDPNAIGFCKLADITDVTGQNLVNGISILPIDRNSNGRMDYVEKIYGNVNELSRGIWIGKYPKELCRNIYAIAPVRPGSENEIAFLKYILTTGQSQLELTGFNSLINSERLSKIDRLPLNVIKDETSTGVNLIQLIITIIAGLVILLAIVGFILRFRRENLPLAKTVRADHLHPINENALSTPKGLLFDKTHTWTFMERDGSVKIGIDDFLQHVTGRLTSIQMKKPGEKVIKGENILTIVQKGKRLNISSPVSGIILTENTNLLTDSSLLNSAPYSDGWIYRIEPTNWMRETQFLFMAEKYTEWLRNEFTRLKDFLARAIKPEDPEYAYVILQDGGEIADHLLENLPPEVWEDFQTQFIDTSK